MKLHQGISAIKGPKPLDFTEAGAPKGDRWRKHRAEEGLIPVLSYKGSIPLGASLELGSLQA